MSEKAKTKEERFLLKLALLESEKEEVSCFEVGRMVGMNHRSVKNAVNLLAQCNFIKKKGEENICLTSIGKEHIATL